jgi:hypothetical protein
VTGAFGIGDRVQMGQTHASLIQEYNHWSSSIVVVALNEGVVRFLTWCLVHPLIQDNVDILVQSTKLVEFHHTPLKVWRVILKYPQVLEING